MSIFGDIFGTVNKVVQKPQSVAMGIINELGGTHDEMRKFIDDYEYARVEDTPQNAAKYEEAKRIVGSSDAPNGGVNQTMMQKLFTGAGLGVQESIRPSDTIDYMNDYQDKGTGMDIAAGVADFLIDPTLLTTGAGKAAANTAAEVGAKALGDDVAFKLPKLVESATTFGKLGKEASNADRLAQTARYLYQGAMIGGDSPMLTLSSALGIGSGERIAGPLLARFLNTAGRQTVADAVEEVVGDGTEKALSRTGKDALAQFAPPGSGIEGDSFTMLPSMKGREIEKWVPNPVEADRLSTDPLVVKARELIQNGEVGTSRAAFASDMDLRPNRANEVMTALANEGTVGPASGGLGRREILNIDRTRVPYSDQGALFDNELMMNPPSLPPVGAQGALPPAPTAMPMQATTSKTVAIPQQELPPLNIQRLPEELMAPAWPVRPPTRQALNAAPEAIPVGPPGPTSMPYVSRPPGMSPDMQMLDTYSSQNLVPKATPELTAALQDSVAATRSVRIPSTVPDDLRAEITAMPAEMAQQVISDAMKISRQKRLPYNDVLRNIVDQMTPEQSADPLFDLLLKATQG